MPDQEFIFAITLSSRDAFDGVLGDVASTVFRQVGWGDSVAVGLLDELHAAIGRGVDSDAFDVQFCARAGACDVIILVRGREIWRASREIP